MGPNAPLTQRMNMSVGTKHPPMIPPMQPPPQPPVSPPARGGGGEEADDDGVEDDGVDDGAVESSTMPPDDEAPEPDSTVDEGEVAYLRKNALMYASIVMPPGAPVGVPS